jgi:hypothetical protein
LGTVGGGGLGLMMPEDKTKSRINNIGRGALRGAGTLGGVGVGMGVGGTLAGALGTVASGGDVLRDGPHGGAALLGMLAGGVGGGYLGNRMANGLLAEPEREEEREAVIDHPFKHKAAAEESVYDACIRHALTKNASLDDAVSDLKFRLNRKDKPVKPEAPKFRLNDMSKEGRDAALLMAIDDHCATLPPGKQAALRQVASDIVGGIDPVQAFEKVVPEGEKTASAEAGRALAGEFYKYAGRLLRKRAAAKTLPTFVANEIKKAAAVFTK